MPHRAALRHHHALRQQNFALVSMSAYMIFSITMVPFAPVLPHRLPAVHPTVADMQGLAPSRSHIKAGLAPSRASWASFHPRERAQRKEESEEERDNMKREREKERGNERDTTGVGEREATSSGTSEREGECESESECV